MVSKHVYSDQDKMFDEKNEIKISPKRSGETKWRKRGLFRRKKKFFCRKFGKFAPDLKGSSL
jgi:hypothetical protein